MFVMAKVIFLYWHVFNAKEERIFKPTEVVFEKSFCQGNFRRRSPFLTELVAIY